MTRYSRRQVVEVMRDAEDGLYDGIDGWLELRDRLRAIADWLEGRCGEWRGDLHGGGSLLIAFAPDGEEEAGR